MFILEKIIALKHLYSKRHDVYALSCPTLRKEVVLKSVTSASTLETEKEEQVKPRVNRRKKKVNIQVEINETENVNEVKNLISEINKIDLKPN